MLTDSKIRAAKPLAKSYKLTDAQGLYLTVSTVIPPKNQCMNK